MPSILSVNISNPTPITAPGLGVTGICKQPGYAVAREELDWWGGELSRDLPNGLFGENLTTTGLDVDGALIGERWRIGEEVVLEVCGPRIPCQTFAVRMGEPHWVKRFTERGRTSAYLAVIQPGTIRPGDPVVVAARPDHGITVPDVIRHGPVTSTSSAGPFGLEQRSVTEAWCATRQTGPATATALHPRPEPTVQRAHTTHGPGGRSPRSSRTRTAGSPQSPRRTGIRTVRPQRSQNPLAGEPVGMQPHFRA